MMRLLVLCLALVLFGAGMVVGEGMANVIVSVEGDTGSQLSGWSLSGVTAENSDELKLYWDVVGVTPNVIVSLFSNSTGIGLVATGFRNGNGLLNLTDTFGSGITGSVTVAYTADDTTLASNIITVETDPDVVPEPNSALTILAALAATGCIIPAIKSAIRT